MKRIGRVFYVLLLVIFVVSGCGKSENSEHASRNSINNGNVVKIKTFNKPTMLIFDLDGCVYCQKLKNDINNNPKIKQLSSKFTIYYINAAEEKTYIIPHEGKSLRTDTKTLEYIYGFRGSTPYIVITDSKFQTVLKIPGYLKPKIFAKVLKFILTKAYEKTDINTYLGLK